MWCVGSAIDQDQGPAWPKAKRSEHQASSIKFMWALLTAEHRSSFNTIVQEPVIFAEFKAMGGQGGTEPTMSRWLAGSCLFALPFSQCFSTSYYTYYTHWQVRSWVWELKKLNGVEKLCVKRSGSVGSIEWVTSWSCVRWCDLGGRDASITALLDPQSLGCRAWGRVEVVTIVTQKHHKLYKG